VNLTRLLNKVLDFWRRGFSIATGKRRKINSVLVIGSRRGYR